MISDAEEQFLRQFESDDDDVEIIEVVGLDEDSPAEDPPEDSEDSPGEVVLNLDQAGEEQEPGVPSAADRGVGSEPVEPDEPDDRLIRLQADFENLTKRADRERQEYGNIALVSLVSRLLPIVDNFERAIDAAADAENPTALRDGVVLIFRQLLGELRKEGLTAIEALGQRFDPHIHEAVETQAATGQTRYRVIEEVRRGYFFNGKLVRPSLVKVDIDASESDD